MKVDGSNRLTLRNRKLLRKIDPVSAHPSSPKLYPTTVGVESPHVQDNPVNACQATSPLPPPALADSDPAPSQDKTAALSRPAQITLSLEGVR